MLEEYDIDKLNPRQNPYAKDLKEQRSVVRIISERSRQRNDTVKEHQGFNTIMIRQATEKDTSRIAEILVFSKRMNYRRIFENDAYSFGDLQVSSVAHTYLKDKNMLFNTWVYTEILTEKYSGETIEIVKGLVEVADGEIRTLYVDSFFTGAGIGGELIEYAKMELGGTYLWTLERNVDAIRFYQKHGFKLTGERQAEPGTEEYLVKLEVRCE